MLRGKQVGKIFDVRTGEQSAFIKNLNKVFINLSELRVHLLCNYLILRNQSINRINHCCKIYRVSLYKFSLNFVTSA